MINPKTPKRVNNFLKQITCSKKAGGYILTCLQYLSLGGITMGAFHFHLLHLYVTSPYFIIKKKQQ